MKKLLILAMILTCSLLGAQNYSIDVSGNDTSLYYKIDNSRPFAIQVETKDIGGTVDGQLYIYNKLKSGYTWNLINNGNIPLTLEDTTGSYLIVNREPACREWLFVYVKNGSTSGYIFINIDDLSRVNNGNPNFSSLGGVSKNFTSDRLSNNRVIDITPVIDTKGKAVYDSTAYTNDGTNITSVLHYYAGELQYKDTLIWDGDFLKTLYTIE